MNIVVKIFEFIGIYFVGIIFYNFLSWISRRVGGNLIFYLLLFVILVPGYYFSFHPQSTHIPSKEKLMFIAFFFMSVLSPILVPEVGRCFKENNANRLEIIALIMTILTIPLGLDLLRNAITTNGNQIASNAIVRQQFDISILFGNAQWTQNGGDKTSYYDLINLMQNSKDKKYKSALSDYISQIKLNYITTNSVVKSIPLCKAQVNCAEYEDENSQSIDNIYSQFINESLWVSRAKAAYLLRFVNNEKIDITNKTAGLKVDWNKILSSLVEDMVSPNERLLVSKTALDSFRILVPEFKTVSPDPTIDSPETVFDFDRARLYWQNNKFNVLARLNK